MEQQKSKKRRRSYDAEFRQNALKMVEDGRSVPSVCQALGISEGVLYKWRSRARQGLRQGEGREADEEIKLLRKRLKEVEQERDILKKALSIFSRRE